VILASFKTTSKFFPYIEINAKAASAQIRERCRAQFLRSFGGDALKQYFALQTKHSTKGSHRSARKDKAVNSPSESITENEVPLKGLAI